MAGVLIVAAAADAGFAEEVRGQTRGLAIEIAPALPAGEQRTVLLVWSAGQPATASDVPALIELWSQNRLVIARRDDTALPLGLGDLEALAPGAPAREAAFRLLHATLAPDQAGGEAPAPARQPTAVGAPAPVVPRPRRRARWPWSTAAAALLALLVLGGSWFMSYQVDRTFSPQPPPPKHASGGPTVRELDNLIRDAERKLAEAERRAQSDPGLAETRAAVERERSGLEKLRHMRTAAVQEAETDARRRIEALERELAAQRQRDFYMAMGAGVLVLAGLGVWLVRRRRRPAVAAAVAEPVATVVPAEALPPPVLVGEMLFVSYAHRDLARVGPIVSEIEAMGRQVWFDRRELGGGSGWAGQITRAIKGSRAVVLMASPSAYASDQVVRELYLAMGAKKQIVPIELEPATLPDELEYILAPFQRHAIQTGEPRAVLARALERL